MGTLVSVASEQEEFLRYLHGTIDFERERSTQLFEENQALRQKLEQVKLELKLERQNKFATNEQKAKNSTGHAATKEPPSTDGPKKRGAPVGHPGWFRPTPTQYDWSVEVPAPVRCPHCQENVSTQASLPPVDHLQADIIDNVYRVVCYRHEAACCDDCGRWVQQAGKDEILNRRIGPYLN